MWVWPAGEVSTKWIRVARKVPCEEKPIWRYRQRPLESNCGMGSRV